MRGILKRFWQEDGGQGLTEYALILAWVAIGLIAVLIVFRDAIGGLFDQIAESLQGAPADTYVPGGGA